MMRLLYRHEDFWAASCLSSDVFYSQIGQRLGFKSGKTYHNYPPLLLLKFQRFFFPQNSGAPGLWKSTVCRWLPSNSLGISWIRFDTIWEVIKTPVGWWLVGGIPRNQAVYWNDRGIFHDFPMFPTLFWRGARDDVCPVMATDGEPKDLSGGFKRLDRHIWIWMFIMCLISIYSDVPIKSPNIYIYVYIYI